MYHDHKTKVKRSAKTIAITGLILIGSSFFHTQTWAAKSESFSDPWQEKRLFSPSKSDLALEDKGQIVIYSGLLDIDVEKAMDMYFDRIESMMFIKTIQTDKNGKPRIDSNTGNVEVADDGC